MTNLTWWQAHRQAWAWLRGPLRMWFLPATGVAVALSALGWWGISWVASDVANRVVDALGVERGEGWIQSLTQGAVSLVLLVVKLKLTKHLVLVCMGPILAMVSEAAEVRLTGRELPFSWRRAWKGRLARAAFSLVARRVRVGRVAALLVGDIDGACARPRVGGADMGLWGVGVRRVDVGLRLGA